jgi:hypothetical protein
LLASVELLALEQFRSFDETSGYQDKMGQDEHSNSIEDDNFHLLDAASVNDEARD